MTFPFNIPTSLVEIVQRIENAGHSAYFVGGCVRDALLGNEPHDYDIASSARPEKVMELFGDCTVIPTGIKHGTVTVLYKGHCAELTTYRKDGAYTDFRHPDNVVFSDNVEDDTARRDFTVNALCYSPSAGVLDFHGGLEDLKLGIIRCVGDPIQRFREDALRILRALRFAARFDFSIEQNSASAILKQKELIKNIAAERVLSELKGFFSAKQSACLARVFLPVLCTAVGVACPEEKDTLLKGLEHLKSEYRLPFFIACLGGDKDGAKTIIQRLKSDNATLLKVVSAAEAMYGSCFERGVDVAYTVRKHGLQNARLMYAVSKVLNKNICNDALMRLDGLESGVLPLNPGNLALNGNEIKALGVSNGKEIGAVLEHLYAIVQEGAQNTKAVLTEEAKIFINGLKR